MILLPPEDQDELMSPQHKALHDDLRRGWHAKAVVAHERQLRMAKLMTELVPRHHPVFGQLTLVVDPVLYEEAKRLHGPECWRDPEFRRQVARDNPQMGMRSTSGKTVIVRPDGAYGRNGTDGGNAV